MIEEDGPTRILEELGGKEIARLPMLHPDHLNVPHPLAVSISPDDSRVQLGSYIFDSKRWEIFLNLHEPGKALWLSHDWKTAAISDSTGLLEFISRNYSGHPDRVNLST